MKILLDECLPRKLKRMLVGYDVFTVQDLGWTGTKNGVLLRLAEKEFDIFVTADQNLVYQQDLRSSVLGIIVLAAPNNRLETYQALMPQASALLQSIKPGEVVYVHSPRQ
jgi:predicted nuclease of predicted toxin-antitoxin system